MSSPYDFNLPRRSQTGSVLIITLVMLIVLTMLMVSAMRTNTAEERMASNVRDWNIAFQAAEAALRDAERDILQVEHVSGITGFQDGCSNTGLCLPSTNGTPVWLRLEAENDTGWLTGTSNGKSVCYGAYTGAEEISGVAAQPRYIVEAIRDPNSITSARYFYRVTAVGFGANVSSRVMLQGVFRQF